MAQPFAVVDVETTGLDADKDELLELGAVLAEPSGAVTRELSVLVRPSQRVPDDTARLTGITQAMVDVEGQPLDRAFAVFLEHIGDRPILCHHAPFDAGFLREATKRARLTFKNVVHDTLPLARQAWPGLTSYRLFEVAELAGGRRPTHRALADARATLDVLIAARRLVSR